MDNVLVTGGAGYVGSHACKALYTAGYTPVTVDSLIRGHRELVKWGPIEVGHIADRGFMDVVMDRHRPIAILHFAAFAYVGESVGSPELYFENNVCGSLALVNSALRHDVRKIVFSSTCSVYGNPVTPTLAEDHPTAPVNPYGRSKLMVETMLRDIGSAHGLRSLSLRYFNAAGADPEGDIGEIHEPETHAVPLAIRTALGLQPCFDIFGTDYPTADGTPVRDYIHVSDLATAHVLGLRYLLDGGDTAVLNLGTGHGHSVQQLLDCVARASGRPVASRAMPRRPGDPPRLVADARKAARVLGWRPVHGNLDAIVGSALRWHRSQMR